MIIWSIRSFGWKHILLSSHESDECSCKWCTINCIQGKSSNFCQHPKLSLSIYHLLYQKNSLPWLRRSFFLLRSSRPTNKCRRRLLVLLRVPMIRRPIFLAYHTELSIVGWGWSVRVWGSRSGKIELVSRLWPAPSTSSYAGILKPVSAHSARRRQKHTVQVPTKSSMQGKRKTQAPWRT